LLHELIHCAEHALKDGALSVPILFISYLLMELLERSRRLDENVLRGYSRKAGPAVGGILGIIPQCGISGAAATLFSTGAVTAGTMLAVFFATSDEMLPVLLSNLGHSREGLTVSVGFIGGVLAVKAVIAVILGYGADALLSRFLDTDKDIHSFCEREHCDCDDEGSVWLSALRHTLKIALMLIGVNFLLNILLSFVGMERLSGSILSKPVIGEVLLALIGLIPNCSVSVAITEAYLYNIIGIGGLFSGLLSNAGIGLLVLYRTNGRMKENIIITLTLFALGALSGIIIGLIF